jgi:paraquat-inducible protein A
MLDVFVVVLMVSFVQFGELIRIEAGPAVVPFGLAVIFTIIATEQFDTRILWDRRE